MPIKLKFIKYVQAKRCFFIYLFLFIRNKNNILTKNEQKRFLLLTNQKNYTIMFILNIFQEEYTMEFLETYKGDIKAFVEALIEFIKTVFSQLLADKESAE